MPDRLPLQAARKATPHESLGALRRDAWREACGVAALGLALAVVVRWQGGFSPALLSTVSILLVLATALVGRGLGGHAPHARFGVANRVTAIRLTVALVLAALLGEAVDGGDDRAWGVVVLATVAALLDALDGRLARRQGLTSAFGARFDMETDAFLILVLSMLLVHFEKCGAWVVASGAMRYAFVAAGWRWAWMNRPLPPSTRRKTVCVVQIVTLIVALGPIISRPWSDAIAAAGLAALLASFAIDTAWLIRRRLEPLARGGLSA